MARSVADIEADLTEAYAARTRLMKGEQVTRSTDGDVTEETTGLTLKEVRSLIAELKSELGSANGAAPRARGFNVLHRD